MRPGRKGEKDIERKREERSIHNESFRPTEKEDLFVENPSGMVQWEVARLGDEERVGQSVF